MTHIDLLITILIKMLYMSSYDVLQFAGRITKIPAFFTPFIDEKSSFFFFFFFSEANEKLSYILITDAENERNKSFDYRLYIEVLFDRNVT